MDLWNCCLAEMFWRGHDLCIRANFCQCFYDAHYISTQKKEFESTGSQALQNVERLVDIIALTLETDGNESVNFSKPGDYISK